MKEITMASDLNASEGEGSLPKPARGKAGDNREDVQAPCDAGSFTFYILNSKCSHFKCTSTM